MRQFVTAGTAIDANPVLLLNSSSLVDPALPARQFVVAWARESRLVDYLSRIPRLIQTASPVAAVRTALDAVGWWRRDWHGYRHATMVLATTSRFRDELARAGVSVTKVHPCVRVPATPAPFPPAAPVRLLSAAYQLGEPRKRMAWMLDALAGFSARGRAVQLTLVGTPTPDIERRAARVPIDVTFTGRLPREAFLAEIDAHHAFLFASALDDWGYVAAEAMSRGRAVVVPDAPPFDEMGAAGAIRFADRADAFVSAVDQVIDTAEVVGHAAHRQAMQAFSHEAFASAIRTIADHRG
jgi:glycosyltransferase involved in cell wall biosynthesis